MSIHLVEKSNSNNSFFFLGHKVWKKKFEYGNSVIHDSSPYPLPFKSSTIVVGRSLVSTASKFDDGAETIDSFLMRHGNPNIKRMVDGCDSVPQHTFVCIDKNTPFAIKKSSCPC